MGTRCVIAFATDDLNWEGRYCHWDGYPESKLPQLETLIARDGVDKVRKTILSTFGWSTLDTDAPEAFDETTTDPGHGDGRFYVVKGYGTGYTRAQWENVGDWVMSTDKDVSDVDAAFFFFVARDGTVTHKEVA